MSVKLYSKTFNIITCYGKILESEEDINNFEKLKQEFFDLPIDKQVFYFHSRLDYTGREKNRFLNILQPFTYYNYSEFDDKLCISAYTYQIFINNKPYVRSIKKVGLTYTKKTKKIKVWFGASLGGKNNELVDVVKKYLKYINTDWFFSMQEGFRSVLTKTLLEGILSGKITNQELYIKKWLSTSIHYKYSWTYVKKLVEKESGMYSKQLLLMLPTIVVNPNLTLKQLVFDELEAEYLSVFNDMKIQAQKINRKINTKWSFKRISDEHLKWSRELNAIALEEGLITNEQVPTFGKLELPETVKGFLITQEQDAYAESNEQSNCIYSSYWNSIKNKTYWVISASFPERCSVGIEKEYFKGGDKIEREKFRVQQIHGRFNKNVKMETKEIFDEWIKKPSVQAYFQENYKVYTEDEYIKRLQELSDIDLGRQPILSTSTKPMAIPIPPPIIQEVIDDDLGIDFDFAQVV